MSVGEHELVHPILDAPLSKTAFCLFLTDARTSVVLTPLGLRLQVRSVRMSELNRDAARLTWPLLEGVLGAGRSLETPALNVHGSIFMLTFNSHHPK